MRRPVLKRSNLRAAALKDQMPADQYRYLHRKKTVWMRFLPPVLLGSVLIIGAIAAWFYSGNMVILGVPSSVILTFLEDEIAFNAYQRGDTVALHDRLNQLGVEEQMKDFYRSQFPDEATLDQHIHQLMYEHTGYVGEAYRVNSNGILVLK